MKTFLSLPWQHKAVLAVLIVVGLVASWYSVVHLKQGCGGLLQNIGTELMGAAATYILFVLVLQRIEEREESGEQLEKEKAALIDDMGSSIRDVAIAAAEKLERRGWITDGSLQGANLQGADLEGVKLQRADLRRADLRDANLQGANLRQANLQETFLRRTALQRADLRRADLRDAVLIGAKLQEAKLQEAFLGEAFLGLAVLIGANLQGADLQGAFLGEANLQGAVLRGADLRGADLRGADLWGADLQEAVLDEKTTLPSGTSWTPDANMAQFTDPKSPRGEKAQGDAHTE